MIITIDGPAGTGKSTIAKMLAAKFGFKYFDTGAMYRAFTWKVLQEKGKDIEELLQDFSFEIKTDREEQKSYYVDGVDVTRAIRMQAVTDKVSEISAKAVVRKKIVSLQREAAEGEDAVFEGRDMGTVVFPNADLKIFLTAKEQIRAERRYKELVEKFPEKMQSFDLKQVLEEIRRRDEYDCSRIVSPLKCPKDALIIDTSNAKAEEVVDMIIKRLETISSSKMRFVYKFFYYLAFFVLKIFYRFKVYGQENYKRGAALIAANHASYLDPPAVAVACPEEVHFLARDTLFRIPLFNILIRKLNTHPVSPTPSSKQTFKLIKDLLKQGNKVVLFPEGTRATTEKIGKIMPGVAFLAYITNTKVLPLYIHGSYRVWSRLHKWPRCFGRISCVFGAPIDPKEFASLEKKEAILAIISRTEKKLNEMKGWCEEGCIGEPP